MSAVTTPTGNSAGTTTVRENRSARTSSIAPPTAEPGRTYRWSAPPISRMRCGTTSPMKPMPPAADTAAPTISATPKIAHRFKESVETPRWYASDSPKLIAFKAAARRSSTNIPITAIGSVMKTTGHVAPPKPPSSQKVRLRSCSSSARNVITPIPAPAKLLSAIPARSSVTVLTLPWDSAIFQTPIVTSIPHTKAARGNPHTPNAPLPINTIHSVAPRPAPAVTPIKPGSASGFRKMPCSVAPEIANIAPTTADKTTRGNRT